MGTTLDLFFSPQSETRLLISPPSSSITYLITFDRVTGHPFYSGIPSIDLFPDRLSALDRIYETNSNCTRLKAISLFGVASDRPNSSFLGIITSTDVCGHLPGMHLIHTVTHVKYIPLTSVSSCPFTEFQLIGNHYFCETHDLTQFFPATSVENPDFIWNKQWIIPFDRIGLSQCCCKLIQGVAITSSFLDRTLTVTYLVRRLATNAGTRYNSRGLDANNDAGNEVECELIFVDQNQFWAHGWRRGSPPIRWRTELKTKLSKPTHRAENDVSRGTIEYFEKLRNALNIPLIRVISLLETTPGKSEVELHNSLKRVVEELGIPFIAFDANRILAEHGSIGCKVEFESLIEPLIDWTSGTLDPFTIESRQASLNRYNCADSLDRTNVVTFYLSLICMKRWDTPQSVIDFLAKGFIASGNIISSLSTNTPAIKSEAIRAFSPSIPSARSDTEVTIDRRLQNVAFDQSRNEILMLFARPPIFPPIVWFDTAHLALFGSFPIKLFDTIPIVARISDCRELILLLPRPVFLRAIQIRACTAQSLMILGDGGEVLGFCSIPQTSAACVYHFDGWFATRFLMLRFFTPIFTCGNIAIAGEIPVSEIIVKPLELVGESNSEFSRAVEKFIGSPRKLRDVLELERIKMSLRIADDVLFNLSSRYLMNPFVWDAAGRLVSAPRNGCAFCEGNGQIVDRFRQNSGMPSLIVRDEKGDLQCCSECLSIAEAICDLLNSFENELVTIEKFEPDLTLPEQDRSFPVISRLSTASFSDTTKNCLLRDNHESVHIPKKACLRLYFHKCAIISSIVVFSTVEPNIGFEKAPTLVQSDGRFVFNFVDELINPIVVFNFHDDAEILRIECIGQLVEHYLPPLNPAECRSDFVFQEHEVEWSSINRTAVYRFQCVKLVKRVGIALSHQNVQNLILCFIFDGELSAWEAVKLPKVDKSTVLFYQFDPYTCDQVHVYYTDRIAQIRPLRIGFNFE